MLNPMRCGCVMAASSEGWTSVKRCPAHSRVSLVIKSDGSTAVVEGSRVIAARYAASYAATADAATAAVYAATAAAAAAAVYAEPLPRDPCWRHYYEDTTLRCTCGSR